MEANLSDSSSSEYSPKHNGENETETEMKKKRTYSATFTNEMDLMQNTSKKMRYEDKTTYESTQSNSNSHFKEAKVAPKNKGEHMMRKMGWVGKGLGKDEQGRLEPVKESTQKDLRGIGYEVPGLEDAKEKWENFRDYEVVKCPEDMNWLKNEHKELPFEDEMKDWMRTGPTKESLHGEADFCHADIVEDILKYKDIFGSLDKLGKRRAHMRCNPFETIRGAFFLNRAAVKMANIDKACDFMFTNANVLDRNGLPNKCNELLYFADVCAGPGGFSEYVLYRKKWHAKGFGFTLKKENDFKLDDFYAGPCETFHPYYGPKDDGNVFDSENQRAFRDLIMRQTKGVGVHFMMSDGGFSVKDRENIQEILSQQLYLCQCLVSLMIVRDGGHFVTKLFDIFTPFSVGLVYLMYRCFSEVCLFKPNSSRPANSERYLICKGKRSNVEHIIDYLSRANEIFEMSSAKGSNLSVIELVPKAELEKDTRFLSYVIESNESLGRRQIASLLKTITFSEDTNRIEDRQAILREASLKDWKLEDVGRTKPSDGEPREIIRNIQFNTQLLENTGRILNEDDETTFKNFLNNWYCMPCATAPNNDENWKATFFISLGRTKVYLYTKGRWTKFSKSVELPRGTLVFAEMVWSCRGEYSKQRKVPTLHILDAHYLGEEDVSKLYINTRHKQIKIFCEALWKPNDNINMRVCAKDLLFINENFKLPYQLCTNKKSLRLPSYFPFVSPESYDAEENETEPQFFEVNSVLFLQGTPTNYGRHLSQSTKHYYICEKGTPLSIYEKDIHGMPKAIVHFPETFKNRIIWNRDPNDPSSIDNLLRRLRYFIEKARNK
ncbi:cap-specific mRNA (nucleoside-2'-O-)-methyltransferase 1 [Orussus abietinus]|uniref:cap-specific mRNA (nucleoside-2'-O-)-methyltransferase 1 n=1 Tax=Orussus abietinus TaxID=222816 RepID=UPI00062586E2|nr:cap-specific mRNA (nucleoside-2'-O-)-methyltransferase 1 [Orussus abietinus]